MSKLTLDPILSVKPKPGSKWAGSRWRGVWEGEGREEEEEDVEKKGGGVWGSAH